MLQYLGKWLFAAVITLQLTACSGPTIEEIDSLDTQYNTNVDIGKGVFITYSDSAALKVTIEAPTLERHTASLDDKEIFKDGIKVTFYDKSEKPSSFLEADMAIRDNREKKVLAQGNVRFYNTEDDKLQSHELIWDEKSGKVYTEKFIRFTRPMVGDTSYGIGFETDQDFQLIRIKRRNQGKMKVDLGN